MNRPAGEPGASTRRSLAGPRLDAVLREEVARQHLIGLSLAVVDTHGLLWAGAQGWADRTAGIRATVRTDYLWFSMTKIVTATAVMQLVDGGVIELDAPAERYLPVFRLVQHSSAVTLRHLLSHSAGLANPIPVRWVRPADRAGPDQRALVAHQLRRHARLQFTPGTRAAYTNLAFLVLGEVIAAVTGMAYTEYVRRYVLQPLGMDHTDFHYDPTRRGERATQYQRCWWLLTPLLKAVLPSGLVAGRSGPYVVYHPFLVNGAAYGGLVGSVIDAAQVTRLHLHGGLAGDTRLLSEAATRLMQHIATRGTPFDVGLGWFRPSRARSAHPPFVEHLGGGLGIYNAMRLYPALGLGMVLMSNLPGYEHDTVLSRVLEAVA